MAIFPIDTQACDRLGGCFRPSSWPVYPMTN